MKDITQLYKNMTNDERVVLFFEAAARMDIEEMDRLNDTCPQKTYRGEDWSYTRKKRSIHDATIMYKIGNDRAIIGALLALVGILTYDNDDDIESSVQALQRGMDVYKGRMLAWQQLCDSLGIDSNTLAKASGLNDTYASDFLINLDFGLEIEPDKEAQAHCYEMLTAIISRN